jgi:hypothetical protein
MNTTSVEQTHENGPVPSVGSGTMVSCRELSPGDTIEHDGKRLVYHGYGTRRGSKLWQLQLTHEVGGGLVLLHLFPDYTVSRVKAANTH